LLLRHPETPLPQRPSSRKQTPQTLYCS